MDNQPFCADTDQNYQRLLAYLDSLVKHIPLTENPNLYD